VTSWAADLVRCYVRHPWALQVSFARPVLGPNEQAVLEALARVLRQAGLPAAVARRVISLLFYVVRGTAQTVADSWLAAAAGGASEQAWWSGRVAALRQVAPDFAQRFPDSAWLAGASAARRQGDPIPYLECKAREAFSPAPGSSRRSGPSRRSTPVRMLTGRRSFRGAPGSPHRRSRRSSSSRMRAKRWAASAEAGSTEAPAYASASTKVR
jgi:hypothetical protein